MGHTNFRAPQPPRRTLNHIAAGGPHGQAPAVASATPPARLPATPTNKGPIRGLPWLNSTYYLVGYPPVSERKQQILATAADILEHKSFAAFSYQDLADRLGIRKASIHHHFKSKDELGIALLKFFQARGDALMAGTLADAKSPGTALQMIFEMCEQVMFDGETKVWPSCAFEVDAKNLSPAMIGMLRESTESFQQQLANLLEAARTGGEITFLGEVMDQAATLVSALQGARTAEPIMGREHFRGVVRQLSRSLGMQA